MPYALIVDDDVDFMPALSQIVQQQGYHVRIAKSLEEARQEQQRGIPDVALIDLLLPDGDGIQLVRDLTLTGSTKVLIITGYAGVESAVAALRAGVTDFMQKPFDVGQLRRQLQLIKDEFDNRLPVETGQLFDENGLGDIVGRGATLDTGVKQQQTNQQNRPALRRKWSRGYRRPDAADAHGVQPRQKGRADRDDRLHLWRERHWQGARCSRRPRLEHAKRQTVRRLELRSGPATTHRHGVFRS